MQHLKRVRIQGYAWWRSVMRDPPQPWAEGASWLRLQGGYLWSMHLTATEGAGWTVYVHRDPVPDDKTSVTEALDHLRKQSAGVCWDLVIVVTGPTPGNTRATAVELVAGKEPKQRRGVSVQRRVRP